MDRPLGGRQPFWLPLTAGEPRHEWKQVLLCPQSKNRLFFYVSICSLTPASNWSSPQQGLFLHFQICQILLVSWSLTQLEIFTIPSIFPRLYHQETRLLLRMRHDWLQSWFVLKTQAGFSISFQIFVSFIRFLQNLISLRCPLDSYVLMRIWQQHIRPFLISWQQKDRLTKDDRRWKHHHSPCIPGTTAKVIMEKSPSSKWPIIGNATTIPDDQFV